MTSADNHPVYWPRGRKTATILPLAPRLASLEGKTVAFLWDYIFRGDEIFPLLQKQLSERFADMRFINYDEFGSTHGDEEQKILASLPDKLRALGVDAVVSGMGC
jgi:hypothetical protein